MAEIGEIITKLRGKDSLREASKKIGISHTYLDTIEKGFDKRSKKPVKPSPDTLRMISKAYNYPYEELLKAAGYIDNSTSNSNNNNDLPILTSKNERDIAKKLEAIINELESDTSLAFDGEPMDENTRELVLSQIESNLRLAKRLAKKKFTPKKYRNE